ncbi:hypothetical protein [Caproiciproducens sp.]
MKRLKIVVLCAMGMSSGMITGKIKDAATQQGYDADVSCYYCYNFRDLDYGAIDIVLMAPQVRNQLSVVAEYVKPMGTKVMQIDMMEYGMQQGDAIFAKALKILEE